MNCINSMNNLSIFTSLKLLQVKKYFMVVGDLGIFSSFHLGILAINRCHEYCIRIRTRRGIYGQIYPLPEGVPKGKAQEELLKAKGYI